MQVFIHRTRRWLFPVLLFLSLCPLALAMQIIEPIVSLSKDRDFFWLSLFVQNFLIAIFAGIPFGLVISVLYPTRTFHAALFLSAPGTLMIISGIDIKSARFIYDLIACGYFALAYLAFTTYSATYFRQRATKQKMGITRIR